MEKKRLVWKVEQEEEANEEGHVARGGAVDAEKLVVELAPMEIRTFTVSF